VPHPFPPQVEMPTDDEALTLFASLQANVYRAFDYQQENEVYDVLAQSVEGAMLEDLYLQVFESLILQYNGGAVCKVGSVKILDSAILEKVEERPFSRSRINLACRWQVDGVV